MHARFGNCAAHYATCTKILTDRAAAGKPRGGGNAEIEGLDIAGLDNVGLDFDGLDNDGRMSG